MQRLLNVEYEKSQDTNAQAPQCSEPGGLISTDQTKAKKRHRSDSPIQCQLLFEFKPWSAQYPINHAQSNHTPGPLKPPFTVAGQLQRPERLSLG